MADEFDDLDALFDDSASRVAIIDEPKVEKKENPLETTEPHPNIRGVKLPRKISDDEFTALFESVIKSNTNIDDMVLIPYMFNTDFAFDVAINERKCLVCDYNPLVGANFESEFFYPSIAGIRNTLTAIAINNYPPSKASSMMNAQSYNEVMSIKGYLDGAPSTSINLWLRRLTAEMLHMPKPDQKEFPYINVKEFVINTYKTIWNTIDPMKILLMHNYVPIFAKDEGELRHFSNNEIIKLVQYAPYRLNGEEYFTRNALKMWFNGIPRQKLKDIVPSEKSEWDARSKKDFLWLHKKLESGGCIVAQVSDEEDIVEFLKLSVFYGYENVGAFENENGLKAFILKKP